MNCAVSDALAGLSFLSLLCSTRQPPGMRGDSRVLKSPPRVVFIGLTVDRGTSVDDYVDIN
jgi:hypothetical protein